MKHHSRRALIALMALFWLTPTAPAEAIKRPTAASEVWARTELYFGTKKPDNTEVTQAEFRGFIDAEVTKRFPDGLTLLTGYGQFLGSNGIVIKETSHVLILFYPAQLQDANKKVQEIRDLYKIAFAQESVLRVDSFSFVSF